MCCTRNSKSFGRSYLGRVAYENVLARPLGLVSSRRPAHPPRTFASPTAQALLAPALLKSYSGDSWCILPARIRQTLDGEPQ